MRLILSILSAGFFAASASAAAIPQDDSCLRAMKDEMDRSLAQLKMDNFPGPYFMAYTLTLERSYDITASLGALIDVRHAPQMHGEAELRVGSPAFDNSNFYGSGELGGANTTSSLDCDYGNTRYNLWQLADRNYKTALEKLDQKRAFREKRNIADQLEDMTPAPLVQTVRDAALEPVDSAKLEELAKTVSAVFRKYPAIDKALVDISVDGSARRYINSEGALYRAATKPATEVEFSAVVQAGDGFTTTQRKSYFYDDIAKLPDADFFRARAEEFAREASALSGSGMAAPYIGPILFEGEAAGQLFDTLLARNLIRPRAWWTDRERDFESGAFSEKLGMRVASPFINVTDDPSLKEWQGQALAGHYEADDEGVPAQKVDLIKKGKLVDLLMSRAPVQERKTSNGHGRSGYSWAEAVPGNLIVSVSSPTPDGEMKSRLIDMCKALDLEYGVILRNADDLRGVFSASRVYVKDGREELVHGFQFADLTPRILRDIVLASDKSRAYAYEYKDTAYSIAAPSVIVQDAELKKTEIKPDKPHYLENPVATAK